MRVIDGLLRDVAFAWRLMRQTPVVSGVALLSLALGVGANVALFSLVNAIMLKSLPAEEPARLVNLVQVGERGPRTAFTNPQWEYLRDHQDFFDEAFAVGTTTFNLNAGGERRPARGLFLGGRAFETLGVTPQLGRAFTPDEDARGGGPSGPAAIVSHGFWQRELGGASDAIGQSLQLDGHAFTIVGVTPPEFFGIEVGRTFDVAVPLGTEPIVRGRDSSLDQRSNWWLQIVARLTPGQTPAQAEARLQAMRPAIRDATLPDDWRPQELERYFTEPFKVLEASTGLSLLRERYRQPLFILLGIVALVLLIACVNMANLLLAQAAARQKELSVRLSLGASRAQLVRQLFVESLLLAGAGAIVGLLIAAWGSWALVGLLSTHNATIVLDLTLDWRVLGFTTAVGIVTGLLFGVAPAVRSTMLTPADTLRDHNRGVLAGGRLGLGHGLVALQVAISFVLVLGAALFVRTLVTLATQETGFRSDGVLIAEVNVRRVGLDGAARTGFFERLRDQVAAIPGVEAAAMSVLTPVSNSGWTSRITIDGYDAPESERRTFVNRVTPGFFTVMGTPIVRGRDFDARDRGGAPVVALVNQAFVAKFSKNRDPIGRTFQQGAGASTRLYEIIGVVADAKYLSLREAPEPTFYSAWAQEPVAAAAPSRYSAAAEVNTTSILSLRTSGAPNNQRTAVVNALQSVHPDVVVQFKTFEDDIRAALTQERLVATLSTVFGAMALLLAVIGLYGVMSYSVARRRNEIGVRMALGAAPRRVLRQVLGHVALITIAGLVVGLALAVGAGRFVDALLFNLVVADGTMLLVAAATLGGAAVIAGYLPARRAANLDPMQALREE